MSVDVDEEGWSPITLAAEQGQGGILHVLLDAGASVDSKNHVGGWRALHCAAANGHVQIVKTLISAGASLDVEVRCARDIYCTWHLECGHSSFCVRVERVSDNYNPSRLSDRKRCPHLCVMSAVDHRVLLQNKIESQTLFTGL